MKKTIFLFFLFSISLFGEFKENKDGFTIQVSESTKYNSTLEITFHDGSLTVYKAIDIIFVAESMPVCFRIGLFYVYFNDNSLDYITTRAGMGYTFRSKINALSYEDGKYKIILVHDDWTKEALKEITRGSLSTISTANEEVHTFDFSKYKDEILNSDFYKNLAN